MIVYGTETAGKVRALMFTLHEESAGLIVTDTDVVPVEDRRRAAQSIESLNAAPPGQEADAVAFSAA